jgi:thiol-disulfide isomerase/thioredoxin
LSAFKGKVVLITFWTTWCPGCVDEVPDLIRLQQEFGAKGFTVVDIAVDDQGEESVESFVKRRSFPVRGASTAINYPVFLGSDEIARKLGFEGGLPAGVLVNRDGREVKVIRGTVSASALARAIRRLLLELFETVPKSCLNQLRFCANSPTASSTRHWCQKLVQNDLLIRKNLSTSF